MIFRLKKPVLKLIQTPSILVAQPKGQMKMQISGHIIYQGSNMNSEITSIVQHHEHHKKTKK